MGQIYEPIISWELRVRVTCRPIPGSPPVTEDGGMKTVKDLRKYFTQFPRRGELFGYVVEKNRKPGFNDDVTISTEVILKYTDQTGPKTLEFTTLQFFVDFLNTHPEIAYKLEYVKKK